VHTILTKIEDSDQVSAVFKRPYLKHGFSLLVHDPKSIGFQQKVAEDTLKGLTSQDFQIIGYYEDIKKTEKFRSGTKPVDRIVSNVWARIKTETLDHI